MSAKKVFVTRAMLEDGLDLLRKNGVDVTVNPLERSMTKSELVEAVKDADGLICLLSDPIDGEVFEAGERLAVCANYAVGYNNIDIAAATGRGIFVTNTPGVLTQATADLTWALLLAITRRIVEGDRYMREGKFSGWGPKLLLGGDISGKTLGIIGAGRIGQAVGKRAAGFGMRMIYCGPCERPEFEAEAGAKRVEMKELLRKSDYVTLHVPLTDDTKRLMNEEQLRLMKKGAYLINTSRGAVIDEDALVKVLREGHLAGAGLDVYEREPKLSRGLAELDNVVLAPHIGSASTETRRRMSVMAGKNVLAVFEGEVPPNCINPEAEKYKG
ncbi:MAG: D-glycerate dehydrogenase [Planctomycetota bacterium]